MGILDWRQGFLHQKDFNSIGKEKALAEAGALLVLKKKVRAIWGDEDDDMEPRSGK